MNRKALKRTMIGENGGKIMFSKSTIGRLLGMGDETVTRMLKGKDYALHGRNHAHMYFIDDIIDAYFSM